MPKLRNLVCQVQWADTGIPFKEYATQYGDGIVETYIAVPDKPQPFSVRLTSKAFIHEGLAAAVYIDGHYQVNRNRVNLLPAKKGLPQERTQIDFLFRQKEKSMGDSTYMGRAWRFDNHNIVPELPEGVTNSHFTMLGNIEVIVRRCVARNQDDTNASTASSGAASDIIEEGSDGEEETPAKEKTKEKNKKKDKPEESVTAAKDDEEGGGMLGGMFGLFDGPSDYGRRPYSFPDRTFGEWNWPSQSQPNSQHDGYASGPRDRERWSSHPGPGHLPQATGHYDSYSHRGPPPSYNPSTHSEKKVHFDYGQGYGLSADPARYWDGPPGSSDGMMRPGAPPHQYHPPGPSDWHRQHSDHHDRPQQPPWSHRHDWDNDRYGQSEEPREGRPYYPNPTPPQQHHAPNYAPPHPPSQYHGPPHAPQYDYQPRHLHPPNAAPPNGWMGAQPMQYWQSHPAYGLPQGTHTSHFGHGHSVYPPYAGMPFRPNPNGSVNSGKDGKPLEQAEGNQKPGSLDPAKEENNPRDDGWGNQNNTNGDSSGNNDTQGGWDTDRKNNTNDSYNTDGNNWDTSGDNKNENSNWESQNDNQNTTDGWNNDSSQQNSSSWENNGQPQTTDTDWENKSANNTTTKDDWGANNNTTAANSGNDWGNDSSKATGNATQSASTPAVQTLYGPHGVYYATRSSIDPEVPCDAEEEPRYDVPQAFATEYHSSKQVQPGKGYLYWKKPSKPRYIDKLEEPYAKFVFKYRTKTELKEDEGIDIETEPSGNEEVQAFQNLEKDELIKMLLRAKGALGGKIPSPPPQAAEIGDDHEKGIAIDPPRVDFLDYDLPPPTLRGGNGGEGKKTTSADNANNDDWSTPTTNNNNSSKSNNDNWGSTANNATSSGNKDWSSGGGGGGWGNDNNASSKNTNTNDSGGNWSGDGGGGGETTAWGDNSGDTPKKSSVTSVHTESATATNNNFTSEAWDAARKQQQSGPPPAGPNRRDSGISPKTKPQENDAFYEQFSDIHSNHAGYGPGYPQPAMPGAWGYDNPNPVGYNGPATQPEPWGPSGGW